jgi:hypothetical protein
MVQEFSGGHAFGAGPVHVEFVLEKVAPGQNILPDV